uniref:KIAA0825 n=1 Tax=Cyprinus carpio carpio TaxID=630221 RepID=A0A9J7WVJ0_CYPCA
MDWQGDFLHDHAFVELQMEGIPSEVDIQNMIRDTEEKLRLNACSIEQNLKELQAKVGEASLGERVPSPIECLQLFSQRNLSILKPVATEHRELLDFLRALQNSMKAGEACEEAVLQLLLNISSQCGVAFPTSWPESTHEHSSSPNLSMPRDDLALEVQEAWDDVRFSLRSHLLGKLQMMTVPSQTEGELGVETRVPQKIFYLQQLLFLYPETKVFSWYQHIQVKAVLSVLQNCQSCIPGGEKGFERLTLGFQSALPTLSSMLREEIQVLNGVAEPHKILAFLNHVYMNTVAQELGVLMDKEIETALKDNTAHGMRGGKMSSKKSAVAPQDPPQGGRSFSLTSHQLRCLTQLTNTLLELEKTVEDLATHLGFLNCAGESVCSGKDVLKKGRDDTEVTAAEDKATTDLVLQSTEVVCLEFGWRAAFKSLVPQMAHCVKVVLDDVCNKNLQQEEAAHASGSTNSFIITPVTHRHGPEKDCPKMVTKFCADVLEQMDAFLPLAVAFREDTLLPVCSSYVEVCGRVTSFLLTRVEERAGDVPASAPFRNLPILMATSVYILQTLTHYESQLRDSKRMPLTLLPIQRSQDVMAALHDHLTSYCVHVCATSILQDAESHYWSDPNPFYEGERCSFSIQMWHYFLTGLRSDLWGSVAPAQARQTLAQVLCETLEVLVQRYSRARPSYKRLSQIRVDITAILLCVEHLMWSVCDSVEELLRPDAAHGSWMWPIHSLCNQLLTVLIILTSPLTELHRVFQGGCGGGSSRTPKFPEGVNSHETKWLSVINPTLFTEELLRDFPACEGSSLCLFELLVSEPCYNPALLLQKILHKDCFLLQIIISYSCLCVERGTEVSPDIHTAAAEFLEAVFSVLSSLNYLPGALTQALEGYLDQRHLWEHFYNFADSSKDEPTLFKCIRSIVCESTTKLLIHLVSMMQACKDQSAALVRQHIPEHVLSKIPKEWNYIPQDPKFNETSKNSMTLAIQALSFIFTHLPSTIASLPLPVRFLFTVAEKRLSQDARQLRSTGLLLWVLLVSLCQDLENGDTLERLSGQPLERGAKDRLSLLSECLQVSLGQQKGVPKPLVHKVLQGLEEKKPKWASMQLQKARKLCCDSVFECGPAQDRGGPAELTEHKIRQLLLELCHRAGGIQHLRRIHHSVQLNESLLRSVLTPHAETHSHPDSPLGPVVFSSEASSQNQLITQFNPLTECNSIGHNKFDQAAMAEREWNWAQLLPAFQSMSQVTFTTLLSNRWEMQDDAALEDEEKILVDQLKKTYFDKSQET